MKELGTLFREDFMEVFVMRHFFADSKFMWDLDLESKLLEIFFEIFDFFFWDGLWNTDLETWLIDEGHIVRSRLFVTEIEDFFTYSYLAEESMLMHDLKDLVHLNDWDKHL